MATTGTATEFLTISLGTIYIIIQLNSAKCPELGIYEGEGFIEFVTRLGYGHLLGAVLYSDFPA